MFIVAVNLLALLGQTKQNCTKINEDINSDKSALNHVTSATDSVKSALSLSLSLSANNATGCHKGGSGYTDAVSVYNATAGLIYLNIYTLPQ